jgi:hypothetical protein
MVIKRFPLENIFCNFCPLKTCSCHHIYSLVTVINVFDELWNYVNLYYFSTDDCKIAHLNWAILLWRHTCRENWVNCAPLTGNSADLRTVLTQKTAHFTQKIPQIPQLRTAHTTMASSVSRYSFSRLSIAWYTLFQIPTLTSYFMLSFLLFE